MSDPGMRGGSTPAHRATIVASPFVCLVSASSAFAGSGEDGRSRIGAEVVSAPIAFAGSGEGGRSRVVVGADVAILFAGATAADRFKAGRDASAVERNVIPDTRH